MTSIQRRDFIKYSSTALSTLAFLRLSSSAQAFPGSPDATVVPWMDQPAPIPEGAPISHLLDWEKLDAWITPNDQFFSAWHFDQPDIDASDWSLQVDGLVAQPLRLSLDDVRARPKQEVVFTVECSGNHGFPFFVGGIGNARWGGTPLAAVLEDAGVADAATEVVFWGADSGLVEIHDDIRDVQMKQAFARSMSLADAMNPNNILCYEMNGKELPHRNGYPLRLIAPGWYGVANVKWLTRIEVRDRRFMGKFMARDYVTIREEDNDGKTVWAETQVGRTLLKSAPAKVTHADSGYRILGAAWGAPIARVDVRIDDGPWQEAVIDQEDEATYAWKIWSFDWPDPAPGEHSVTSRAVDVNGGVQPAMDDPWIANKHTYWESNGQVTRRVVIG